MNNYCYKTNIDKDLDDSTISKLKTFVESIYKNPKYSDDPFTEDEDLPFGVIYTPEEREVCISMKTKSQASIDKVNKIHKYLNDNNTNIVFNKNIKLRTPYLFGEETCNWWDTECIIKKGDKLWETLSHRGPYFTHIMEPYKPLGASLIYEGKKYKLTPKEEEIAGFYAKRVISDSSGNIIEKFTKNDDFNQNFWGDFQKYLTPEHRSIFKKFDKIKFDDLVEKILENKERLKEEAKADKNKKIRTEEKKRTYGFAKVDGKIQAIGNYTVEPASIFLGRGADNKLRGKIKTPINPEDVIINVGKNDKVPTPPEGHSWNAVVHDQKAKWLARWTDPLTNSIKYVLFSAQGKFKGQSDFAKYEKANKLNEEIETIRKNYMADANSSNNKQKQLGTVLYLIDRHGLRVGNEKDEDDTETVGASTLLVENIKLDKKRPNNITLEFLGKDSIQYNKDHQVPPVIYKNFIDLIKSKGKKDQIFDAISSKDINEYLKKFDPDFSAKVFRTRLATEVMSKALDDLGDIPEDSTKAQQKVLFRKANAHVAEILNHQRTVSEKAKEKILKLRQELKDLEAERDEKEAEGKSTASIDKRIDAKKAAIETSSDTLSVAINTSLTNYIDPRLVMNWIIKNNVDISSVYTPILQKKFEWAKRMTGYVEPDKKSVSPTSRKSASPKTRKTVSPRSVSPRSVSPKPSLPRSVSPKPVLPRSVSPKPSSPRSVSPRSVSPKLVSPKPVSPKPSSPRSVTPKTIFKSFIFGGKEWGSVESFINTIKKEGVIKNKKDENKLLLLAYFSLYSQNPELKNPANTPNLIKVDACINKLKNKNLREESKFENLKL